MNYVLIAAVDFDGILGNIADTVGTFLPNVAAALGVLIGGWIVAIIVSKIIGAAIAKTPLNNSLAGFFPAKNGKPANPAKSLGKIVYYLLMLFVLVAFFNTLNLPMVTEPLQGFLDQIFTFLPKLFAAGALGIVGWIVARIGKTVTKSGLEAADIDGKMNSLTSGASSLGSGVVGAVDRVADGVGGAVGGVVDTVGGAASGVVDTVGGAIDRTVSFGDDADDIVLDSDSFVADVADEVGYAGSSVPPGAPDYPSQQGYSTPEYTAPAATPAFEPESTSSSLVPQQTGMARQEASLATDDGLKLSETIPDLVYWVILLLFLPAILGALQMAALLEPVQSMMKKATDFVPNIFGAAIIFGIGWFVAKIVSEIVSNLAASAGVNALSNKLGVGGGGGSKISDVLGIVVKVMILFPALVAALNALKIDAITAPAMDILNKITGMIPGFIGGALTVGIAFFVGKIVSELVTELLAGAGANSWPGKMGLSANAGSEINVAGLVGKFILATTVFFAVVQALPMMGLDALGGYANEFVGFAAQILVGLVVMGGGFVLANFVGNMVNESGIENAGTLANVAKISVMVLSAAMGLQRMGLGTSIVNLAFGLTLGALALAGGIAFGWGGRDAAKKICDRYVG